MKPINGRALLAIGMAFSLLLLVPGAERGAIALPDSGAPTAAGFGFVELGAPLSGADPWLSNAAHILGGGAFLDSKGMIWTWNAQSQSFTNLIHRFDPPNVVGSAGKGGEFIALGYESSIAFISIDGTALGSMPISSSPTGVQPRSNGGAIITDPNGVMTTAPRVEQNKGLNGYQEGDKSLKVNNMYIWLNNPTTVADFSGNDFIAGLENGDILHLANDGIIVNSTTLAGEPRALGVSGDILYVGLNDGNEGSIEILDQDLQHITRVTGLSPIVDLTPGESGVVYVASGPQVLAVNVDPASRSFGEWHVILNARAEINSLIYEQGTLSVSLRDRSGFYFGTFNGPPKVPSAVPNWR